MAIKVMVSLMTKLLLMVLPKIPSLNGDQSKGDFIMCADVMTVNKGLGEYNLGWCVRQICIFV